MNPEFVGAAPSPAAGALREALDEALEVIDLQERAADGDQSAMLDIRIRPSVMKTWLRKVRALAAADAAPERTLPSVDPAEDVKQTLRGLARKYVGTPPNVDGIDAEIGYALVDCENRILAALRAGAKE